MKFENLDDALRRLAEKACKDGTHPEKHVQALKDHIEAHEMLMFNIALNNPQYMEVIRSQYPAFPIFFEMPLPPEPVEEPMPMDLPPEAMGGDVPLDQPMPGPMVGPA